MLYPVCLAYTGTTALLAVVAQASQGNVAVAAILAIIAVTVPVIFTGLFPALVAEGFDLEFSKVRLFGYALCFCVPLGLCLGFI